MYRFGPFTLDPASRRLLRDGEEIALTATPWDLLLHLIENRHRVVTREELIARFWSRTPHGADDRLNSAVRRVRSALNDDGETRMIETAPRVGYRFAAKVETAASASERSSSSKPRAISWAVPASGVAAVFALFVAAGPPFTPPAAGDGFVLAVTPMETYCDQSPLPFFEDGLQDALMLALRDRLPESARLINAADRALEQPGEAHDAYLDLSIRHMSAGSVLVHAELRLREDNATLWAADFEAPVDLADYSTAQRAIAEDVADGALRQRRRIS